MRRNNLVITLLLILLPIVMFGQGKVYEGPDDPAGDRSYRREGWMSGNNVYLYFKNNTELSNCCGIRYSKWPKGEGGLPMTDGVALLIGARVYLENDSIPVTNISEIESRNDLDTLYYLQTSYREETDKDRNTGIIEWGLNPVPGYNNPNDEYVAMSNIPNSWPQEGWPAPNGQTKWQGEWNGRFGRGVTYAQQETFFVANDAQDQEYLQPESPLKYYPRPGIKIGDKNPEVTTQYGDPWGGIGIRVEQRGFQWSNPQAQDAIFWEYNIANISDYDLTEVAFGYWVDNGIGGNNPTDDLGYFDTKLDMSYSWDIDGIGTGGFETGIMGFAYLESPGMSNDMIDNDEDGLIDERRDDEDAGTLIGPTDGISNMEDFLSFYGLEESQLKTHWSSDEDQDWQDGRDENEDGIYQPQEFYGDDVGLDGVGPLDLNYTGPDADGTECNHKPDYKEGFGSEPNYAATDVSESDMIGLTTFQLFQVPDHNSQEGWFRDDKGMWFKTSSDELMEYSGAVTNLVEFFASATFPLYQGRSERISMAMVHSYDNLEGLNSTEHNAPTLFRKKEVVQAIYETDYRFAQPPEMPTLKATPADGKVILTWDDLADKQTRDPFVGNQNDFEGYKLYKATDKFFKDAKEITDGAGTPVYHKPIFQCDKIDGKQGYAQFGDINGALYYLGNESGIQHYFIDNNVQNGRTYYYGLVAYDYGIPDIGEGITPSENDLWIDLDENEEIRNLGRNIQVVTPGQKAIGYVPPSITMLEPTDTDIRGHELIPEVIDNRSVKPGNTYKIKFKTEQVDSLNNSPYHHELDRLFVTSGYYVYDATNGNDSLIYYESSEQSPGYNMQYNAKTGWDDKHWHFTPEKDLKSDIFDGVQLTMNFPYLTSNVEEPTQGWVNGDSPLEVKLSEVEAKYFPFEYDIVFTGDEETYTGILDYPRRIYDTEYYYVSSSKLLLNHDFNFKVINKSVKDSSGNFEQLDLVVNDINKNGQFDLDEDQVLAGHIHYEKFHYRWAGTVLGISFKNIENEDDMPEAGDVYRVSFKRPLSESDSLVFKVNPPVEEKDNQIEDGMKNIKVVPNPYVATNMMEPAVNNYQLNQRRRLLFTHIPAQCKISIYTMSGVFVDEILVDNLSDEGTVHWDMLTSEGLEIAAGIYIYHVKSEKTGDEKIGKFAVIK